MAFDKVLLNRLFVAVPELATHPGFTAALVDAGIISPEILKIWNGVRAEHKIKVPTGKPLLDRILQVAPELLSVRLLQALQAMRLVDTKQANILRVMLRATSRLVPDPVREVTIWNRLGAVFDDVFSPDLVNYIRALDNAQIESLRRILRGDRSRLTSDDAALIRDMLAKSIGRAQVLRSIISTGRLIREDVQKARQLDTVWDVMTLVFDRAFSPKMLANLVRAGLISPERYALAVSLSQFGAGVWRKLSLAKTYESWAARTLLMSESVLSPDTIRILVQLGVLDERMAEVLYPVARAIRAITREAGNNWRAGRRYRVVPGEKPIKTFARGTQLTDKQILQLLAEAAKDAERDIAALMKTKRWADLTRARQQMLVRSTLLNTMRDVFGNVGSLIIFGEKQAAQSALSAMDELLKVYGDDSAAVRRLLRLQAQNGVDSFISREESMRALSRRIYGNSNVLTGRVDREIAKGLLRGLNAQEMAGIVGRFIRPDVPGGASYAAMRLARTEINNAFHQTSIRYTREMPWVEGYRWNLSGSHPKPDVCNDYAEHSEGAGKGVWRKDGVPGKPHPQCLCYVTTVSADTGTWYKRYRSGAYDAYLDQITAKGVFDEDTYTPTRARDVVTGNARAAILNLLAGGVEEAGRMLLAYSGR